MTQTPSQDKYGSRLYADIKKRPGHGVVEQAILRLCLFSGCRVCGWGFRPTLNPTSPKPEALNHKPVLLDTILLELCAQWPCVFP